VAFEVERVLYDFAQPISARLTMSSAPEAGAVSTQCTAHSRYWSAHFFGAISVELFSAEQAPAEVASTLRNTKMQDSARAVQAAAERPCARAG
jgi:hypothetical protein